MINKLDALIHKEKPIAPWVFFFLILPTGISVGFASVTLPFVLAKHGFAIATIASITAIGISANLWRFLWAPLADTTLSLKKWYLIGTTICALALAVFIFIPLDVHSAGILIPIAFFSQIAATFVMSPSSAYLAKNVVVEQKGRAAGWFQAGNLGGMGLGGGAGIWMAENWSYQGAIIVLAIACIACIMILKLVPEGTHQKEKKFSDQFKAIAVDLRDMLKSPLALFIILVIILPIGSGAASNIWSSIASEWKVNGDTVALVTGTLSGLVSVLGCIVGGWITDKLSKWWNYFGSGIFMALVTLIMMVMHFTPAVYIGGILFYAFATGMVYAGFTGLLLFAIGKKGLASTKYSLLSSIGNIPVVYMTAIEGWMHDKHGTKSMLLTESIAGIFFVLICLLLLKKLNIKQQAA